MLVRVVLVLVLLVVLVVTGVKQSQLLVLRLSLEFDKIVLNRPFVISQCLVTSLKSFKV